MFSELKFFFYWAFVYCVHTIFWHINHWYDIVKCKLLYVKEKRKKKYKPITSSHFEVYYKLCNKLKPSKLLPQFPFLLLCQPMQTHLLYSYLLTSFNNQYTYIDICTYELLQRITIAACCTHHWSHSQMYNVQ